VLTYVQQVRICASQIWTTPWLQLLSRRWCTWLIPPTWILCVSVRLLRVGGDKVVFKSVASRWMGHLSTMFIELTNPYKPLQTFTNPDMRSLPLFDYAHTHTHWHTHLLSGTCIFIMCTPVVTHARTHTHTYTRTLIVKHAQLHIRTHTHINTQAHTHTHTHRHTRIVTNAHIHRHTRTHSHTHIHWHSVCFSCQTPGQWAWTGSLVLLSRWSCYINPPKNGEIAHETLWTPLLLDF